jgi:pimeloyl-ACP methyl ester carboxylesterase
MGSLVALRLAADWPGVSALWLQSPFATLPEMALHYVHRATSLPKWLLAWPTKLALFRIERTTGIALSAVDPIQAAARVSCPTMIVHGEEDSLVPIELAPALYDALAGDKEFWRVERCGHCHHPDEPQAVRSREYVKRWIAFFARHVPAEAR